MKSEDTYTYGATVSIDGVIFYCFNEDYINMSDFVNFEYFILQNAAKHKHILFKRMYDHVSNISYLISLN